MKQVPIGTIVYIKKSSRTFYNPEETPMEIIDIKKKVGGPVYAILNNEVKISFGELTDVPCS
jgi:hypothetical protein